MKKGFTLVELVIVIAVIAILAGVLVPTFSSVINNSKKSQALQEIRLAYEEIMLETTLLNEYFDDNTIFEDSTGKYYFKIDNGEFRECKENELTNVSNLKKTDFGNFKALSNVNVELGSSASGYDGAVEFYKSYHTDGVGNNTTVTNADKYVEVNFSSQNNVTLVIKNEKGRIVYNHNYTDEGRTRIYFSMYTKQGVDHENDTNADTFAAGNSTNMETKAQASGHYYHYELTSGNTLIGEGFFYYE